MVMFSRMFDNEQSRTNARRSVPSIGPFLVLHHGTMDIGHDVVSVHHAVSSLGEHDVCIDREFSRETGDQQCWGRSNGMHLEDMEDLVELHLLACNLLLVVLHMGKT